MFYFPQKVLKCNNFKLKESIPVGCIPPAFVVRREGGWGSLPPIPYPPWGTLRPRDTTPHQYILPPHTLHLPDPDTQPPSPERVWDQSYPTPPLDRMTHAYENITFSQLRWRTAKMRQINW